jgi:hypothetical protein
VAGVTSPAAPPRGRPVDVTVGGRPLAPAVPRDFLGLSFEAWNLPRIAAYAERGNLVALLRSLGTGVMRFGGVSADLQAAWSQNGTAAPSWASTRISPADLAGIAALARKTHWRVLLTVNLGHYDARAAAREVRAARGLLGHNLAAVAIGNEPDKYTSKRLRGRGWTLATYARQVRAYRAAIEAAAPGVRLAGPDASSGAPGLGWVVAAARGEHPTLLTDHFYPSTSCGYRPRLSDLASPLIRAAETTMLSQLRAISRAAAIPLRLDETNDISCHGAPGVSDSFASALWGLDYVVRAMRAGLAGVNFHDLIAEPRAYSPLAATNQRALAAGALSAKPEWYALLLARRLLGDQPLRATIAGRASNLTAAALLSRRRRLHVVLIDYDPPGSEPLLVRLHVAPRYRSGAILRLTAPSPGALRDVRLGGRRITSAGTWAPRSPLPRVYRRSRSLELELAPSSAALVTLYAR